MSPVNLQDMQEKARLRRTLLIGLGGTGQNVLVQLKALFVRNYGEVPRAVQFLCLDTDQRAEQVQVNGKMVRLTTDTELVGIGNIDQARVLRNLEAHPAIASWIMEDKEKVPTAAITMGAKQVRPLGRLALFWQIDRIRNLITQAVASLTHINLALDTSDEDDAGKQHGINIFIISSVCGGTGSGIFLDIAYLVRHVIERSGIPGSKCYVNGFLALPSVFPTVNKMGIESNAYAALAELDAFTEGMDWRCDYGDPNVGEVYFSGQRPFNICYLIDARNEQGHGLNGMDQVAPMLAQAIYLQISSQVGQSNASVFDNVDVLALREEFKEERKYKITAYSSLGTSSLVYPVQRIIDVCAHRLGRDLLEKSILAARASEARVKDEVKDFLQSQNLVAETLMDKLSRNADNNLMQVMMNPSALDPYGEDKIVAASVAYCNKVENQVDNDYARMLEYNRNMLVESLTRALSDEVNSQLNDPEGGLNLAVAFLNSLEDALQEARRVMDKEKAERDAKIQTQKKETDGSLQGLDTAVRSGFLGRSGRVREARNRHIDRYKVFLTAKYESRKREHAINVLARLSNEISGLRARVQQLINQLSFVQTRFEAYTKEADAKGLRSDFILEQTITDEKDLQNFYKDYYERLGAAPAANLVAEKGPLHTWLDLEQKDLNDRILDYCKAVFQPLDKINIENLILQKSQQVDPLRRLRDLIDRSVPFWMFDREGMLSGAWRSTRIQAIGVPDKESSIYSGEYNYAEEMSVLTSTFDPHKIIVLQTKHGLPIFALTQYKDYKRAHDHVLKVGLKPLYIIPQIRPGGEGAKQSFALGLAYGFIFKSGTIYFVIPEDPGKQADRLEQGMNDSLRTFRNNEDLIRRVDNMVQAEIRRTGNEAATAILEAFVNTQYVYELKGGATRIVNINREDLQKDSSVGKPGSANFELVNGDLRNAVISYIGKVLHG